MAPPPRDRLYSIQPSGNALISGAPADIRAGEFFSRCFPSPTFDTEARAARTRVLMAVAAIRARYYRSSQSPRIDTMAVRAQRTTQARCEGE